MIENFEKNEHVLAIKYFHEIGKKWKKRKHFILTVLKVGQCKKNYFCHFWPFSWLFWRVLKKLSEKKNEHILTPPLKSMKEAPNPKNKKNLPWPTLKTDKIKCTPFLDFLPISWFFWGGQKIFRKNHASQDGQICNFSSEHARNPRFLGMGNH